MQKVNSYIILDFETGGLSSSKNAITEIAMICIDGKTLEEVERYESYITPYIGYEYTDEALSYTGITMQLLNLKGKELKIVGREVSEFFKRCKEKTSNTHTKKPILVGQNIKFDVGFLQQLFKESKLLLNTFLDGDVDFYGNYQPNCIDTINLAKHIFGGNENMVDYKLRTICQKLNVSLSDAHKAMNDVEATKDVLIECIRKLRSNTVSSQSELDFRKTFKFNY